MLTVEHSFELPCGYIDANGDLHRRGRMRLATAADEILPMKDPRVQNLPAYLIVIVLSRVVVQLGNVTDINPSIIEGLFAEDLAHLQGLYNEVNGLGTKSLDVTCPNCAQHHTVAVEPLGGSLATP